MAWRGDNTNPVPNNQQEAANRHEDRIEVNRAKQVRRDTDKQKDFTVRLIDIDTTIMSQLEKFNLQVVDGGNNIKVPLYYASPEKWASIQKHGIIRDYQGKMILPALVFKRTTSEKDPALLAFNRYLRYPVMKKYSTKNKYTQFSALVPQNAPINEVYDVVTPDHMIFTYHFIIWTEYVEQNNAIVERLNFETEDYWGEPDGFRFRTRIDSFSHTIELQVDQDRIVKTEFDMMVHGYLLPDVYNDMKGFHPTTQKWLTPKKVVMGLEVVSTGFDLNSTIKNENSEKWKSQQYPNLDYGDKIPPAPMVFDSDLSDVSMIIPRSPGDGTDIVNALKVASFKSPTVCWHFPPAGFGQEGWISYDRNYYYIYVSGSWRRAPLSQFDFVSVSPWAPPDTGSLGVSGDLIFSALQTATIATPMVIWQFPPPKLSTDTGREGRISFDTDYYYIYVGKVWRRIPIILFNIFSTFT